MDSFSQYVNQATIDDRLVITCAMYISVVSGDSNFSMGHTGLTVGGFTQPTVARNIVCNPGNSDKGLCQRFLWLLPKPKSVAFEELQKVDQGFCTSIGNDTDIHNVLSMECFVHYTFLQKPTRYYYLSYLCLD